MRIKENKKGTAEIERGLVMMSIEGNREEVEAAQGKMNAAGWKDTDCMDEIEDEVYAVYFVVERSEVAALKAEFKIVKAAA